MEVLYPRCTGLDVHEATVVAGGSRVAREVRTFATTHRQGLLELAEWLAENGCTYVAMEATGISGGRPGTSSPSTGSPWCWRTRRRSRTSPAARRLLCGGLRLLVLDREVGRARAAVDGHEQEALAALAIGGPQLGQVLQSTWTKPSSYSLNLPAGFSGLVGTGRRLRPAALRMR